LSAFQLDGAFFSVNDQVSSLPPGRVFIPLRRLILAIVRLLQNAAERNLIGFVLVNFPVSSPVGSTDTLEYAIFAVADTEEKVVLLERVETD